MKTIINDWYELLKNEFNKDYYIKLMAFLKEEYANKTIFPAKEQIYNALNKTAYKDVSVVLLGQDPYPGKGQAHGMAFSVNIGVPTPRSLINIYKELNTDLGCYIPNHGNLEKWAHQGVLLLNTALTVREGEPNSHQGKGWEILTDKIISLVNEKTDPVVFLLWGNNAKSKKSLITNSRHFIIECTHPSPLSANRGFFDSKPFSRANDCLVSSGRQAIDWQIDNV